MPRFNANLSMLFGEHAFLDRFNAAAEAGFQGVEFLFPYGYTTAELKEALQANQLTQVLFNMPPGDWALGERGMCCHPSRQNEFRESVEHALEYATALDCQQLHAMAGIRPDGISEEALRETYVENLHFAAELCEQLGVRLLIEAINSRDMPGYFLNKSAQAISVIEDVESSNLWFQYDVYHMQIMEGNLLPTIRKLLSQISHFQIADTPGRHEPGTGEINYPFLFSKLDELGYQGWIGCEYGPISGTLEGLHWASEWLQR
jgi:hydroxypyruvate isomerase